MDQLWHLLEGEHAQQSSASAEATVLSILIAFVLGQLLAWAYQATHQGLSYSTSFVQSLVLIPVIVALVMVVIGTSLVTALGLAGGLAIVRFRNVLKDTRDVVFVFAALAVGLAAGTQRIAIALIGAVAFCALAGYLHLTDFGRRRMANAFLRFCMPRGSAGSREAVQIMQQFCDNLMLVSTQSLDGSDDVECAYQLSILDSRRNDDLVEALGRIPSIKGVHLAVQEELVEV